MTGPVMSLDEKDIRELHQGVERWPGPMLTISKEKLLAVCQYALACPRGPNGSNPYHNADGASPSRAEKLDTLRTLSDEQLLGFALRLWEDLDRALLSENAKPSETAFIPERNTAGYHQLLWHIAGCPPGAWDDGEMDNMVMRVRAGLDAWIAEGKPE